MSNPTSETLDRIKETAKLRVEGSTWAEIAEKYGYKNESSACTMLTQEHPQLWREAYDKARAAFLDGIEIGAIERQVVLSRQSDNLSVAQAATHSLLAHCAKLRAMHVNITGSMEHGLVTTTDLIARANEGRMTRGNPIAGLLEEGEESCHVDTV